MPAHVSPPPNSSKTELEVVVNWRIIALGGALAALLVVVPVAGIALFGGPKAEPPELAVPIVSNRPVTAPQAESPRLRFNLAAVTALEPPALEIPELVPIPATVLVPRPLRKVIAAARTEPPEPVAAAPVEKTATPATPARRPKRLDYLYDYEALHQLRDIPEFEIDQSLKTSLLSDKSKDAKPAGAKPEPKHALLELATKRTDLKGLPLRQAEECQKKKEAAKVLQALSIHFRTVNERDSRRRAGSASLSDQFAADAALVKTLLGAGLSDQVKKTARCSQTLSKDFTWDGKMGCDELAVLVQMLQVNGPPVRIQLVEMLDACSEAASSALLAQRALFDLDADVREAAVAALKNRPRSLYRQVLLDGLRHPWPPVAAHAAEAIAELQDIDAAPQLVALLDKPDPRAPSLTADNRWVVREMVAINHLRNCLLCHASSHDVADLGRSLVPKPGEALPRYREGIKGDAVRADITYLRQDFSAMQFVPKPDKWPQMQRFDYIVRARELTAAEVNRYQNEKSGCDPTDYPQRTAVLFALRELTGEDAGTSSTDWRRLLGKTGLDDSR